MVIALVLAVSGAAACSDSGGSVASFCTSVKQNSKALNDHAVGVGVDNQHIMEAHVAAYEAVTKDAPTEIKKQTKYIADKQKKFLEAWRTGQFKTNTMPDFDPGLGTRYAAVDTFVSAKCGVTIT
jgi:hypothetical protein